MSHTYHGTLQAEDFSEIIKLHKEYVTKIHDRCLLNEKVTMVAVIAWTICIKIDVVQASFVKEAVLRILGLALNFGKKWQLALATTRYFCIIIVMCTFI